MTSLKINDYEIYIYGKKDDLVEVEIVQNGLFQVIQSLYSF